MFWKKTGLLCIVAVALAIVGYGQTTTKQRARSANMQGAPSIGYLGVGVQSLTDERVKALNLKERSGVEVKTVTESAPASRAGIKTSDVILEVNGQKIDSSEQFTDAILGKAPGTKVTLVVTRNGAKQTMVATLGLRPADLPLNGAPESMVPSPFGIPNPDDIQPMPAPRIGFEGEPLTPQLAEFFGVHDGVLVRAVTEKTAAEKAGLKAGDIVTKVNGMPVTSPREISGIVRQSKKTVIFTVVRNKKEMTLNLEVAMNRIPSPFVCQPTLAEC